MVVALLNNKDTEEVDINFKKPPFRLQDQCQKCKAHALKFTKRRCGCPVLPHHDAWSFFRVEVYISDIWPSSDAWISSARCQDVRLKSGSQIHPISPKQLASSALISVYRALTSEATEKEGLACQHLYLYRLCSLANSEISTLAGSLPRDVTATGVCSD